MANLRFFLSDFGVVTNNLNVRAVLSKNIDNCVEFYAVHDNSIIIASKRARVSWGLLLYACKMLGFELNKLPLPDHFTGMFLKARYLSLRLATVIDSDDLFFR